MMTRRSLIAHALIALGNSVTRAHAQTESGSWRQALPGYRYAFPRDHLDHPEFRTEWWYFTGNLQTESGRPFGYELTFFRQSRGTGKIPGNPWRVDQLYLAHLALSDIQNGSFRHFERLNRSGPGIAGIDRGRQLIWNGNWSAQLADEDRWKLSAVEQGIHLSLELRSLKRPVLHGKDGVHQKSTEHGSASHYVSLTRLESTGNLVLDGRESALSGLSWMDHEFFSNLLAEGQVGWDWFSMQFENGTELMLFRLRHREEQKSSSGGSFVQKDGTVVEIAAGEMQLQTTEHFRSRKTNATYPIGWRIAIPRLNVELRTTTHLRDQELVSKLGISPKYWEGAIECEGTMQGVAMRGKGYLELTGYADTVQIERDGPQVRGR